MNFKDRLNSTENLLRDIRSGEAASSPSGGNTALPQTSSIWTRKVSVSNLFSRRENPRPEPAPGASATHHRRRSFWTRSLSFGSGGRGSCLGVSISTGNLNMVLVNRSSRSILAAKRFRFGPGESFGEPGFVRFLQACLATVPGLTAQTETWAVLRSADMDLSVLCVPKLSGAKLDTAVFWSLQKERKFSEAEYVLDYRVMGPTKSASEPRLDVLTCLARRADVEKLRDCFREAGRQLTGITALPSALLNAYRLPGAPVGHALAANIHVETDFSAIGLYDAERLRFSRFIRSGANSMAEALVEHFKERSRPKPMPLGDLEMPLPGAARTGSAPAERLVQPLDFMQAQGLLRHVLLGRPRPNDLDESHFLAEAETLEIISPAIERLARQVERTLDYYASTGQQRCDVLHLSGTIFGSRPVMAALGQQLGFAPQVFEAASMMDDGAEKISPEDRRSLNPALCAALSPHGKGINLLATYKQRTARESSRTVTRMLILGLAAAMLAIGAAGLLLEGVNHAKRDELTRAKAQLAALGPMADESALSSSVTQFKARQGALRQAADRYLAPALVAELARRTPENVKVTSLTIDMLAPGAEPATKDKPAPTRTLIVVEGVITGPKSGFEATLSRLIIDLQSSPMLAMPVVHQTNLRDMPPEGQVLYFVLHAGVN